VDQQISLEIAIPLGLIISEIIANSLKYAHKEAGTCTTFISLLRQNDSMILTVKDNGAGFPDDFDPSESSGLGIQLITVLVEQIKGKINFYNKNGAVTEIFFPVS
ncbi:MAG: sensor histidine kinase, partial [Spirochaetales bacterium]|nr:sensor histidine kinase [Spirochaetales bacterium]